MESLKSANEEGDRNIMMSSVEFSIADTGGTSLGV